MREIKFRGKDTNGDWHYGLLAIVKTNQMKIVKSGYYISNDLGHAYAYQVRPETVGQYIERKDNNGKEIYAGDILMSGKSIALVEYSDDIDQDFYWGNAIGFVFNFDPDKMDKNGYEIISNIYENEDLLNED